MALNPQEAAAEARAQISRLGLSPGWGLVVAHWQQRAKRKSMGLAQALREGRSTDAILAQGWLDGWTELVTAVERLCEPPSNGDTPSY